MFWSIIEIVIIPICLGLAVKSSCLKFAAVAVDYLPAVSAIAISDNRRVIGASRNAILLQSSALILLVVILQCVCGYALGFLAAKATGRSWKKSCRPLYQSACRIPVWLRAWPKLTLPLCLWLRFPALSGAWRNISSAILAFIYNELPEPQV